jgi:hypothetical protein
MESHLLPRAWMWSQTSRGDGRQNQGRKNKKENKSINNIIIFHGMFSE